MRYLWFVCIVILGCGNSPEEPPRYWPTVASAPRLDLTAEQGEAYRALSHGLSNYMNARAENLEVDLEKAAILEEVLLHVRAFDDADWSRARTDFERPWAQAKLVNKTVITLSLEKDAPYIASWNAGDPWTGQPIIDDLIRDLNITVQPYDKLLPTFFNLVVPREVNGNALENRIAPACGLLFPLENWDLYAVGNFAHLGDSASVRLDGKPDGWSVRIWVGWGDCPSGCIYGRSYSFEVDTSGQTRLVGVEGEPLQ